MIYHSFILDKVISDTSSHWYLGYRTCSRKKACTRLQYAIEVLETLRHHSENSLLVQVYSFQRDLCSQRIFEIDSELD